MAAEEFTYNDLANYPEQSAPLSGATSDGAAEDDGNAFQAALQRSIEEARPAGSILEDPADTEMNKGAATSVADKISRAALPTNLEIFEPEGTEGKIPRSPIDESSSEEAPLALTFEAPAPGPIAVAATVAAAESSRPEQVSIPVEDKADFQLTETPSERADLAIVRSNETSELPLPDELELSPEHTELMSAIAGEVGSTDYQHYYVRDPETGEEVDVLEDGRESCAFFVSNVLEDQGLLPCAHATTESTMQCMRENGWEPDEEERIGDVVAWFPEPYTQYHLGFVVGPGLYVSHSSRSCVPTVHDSSWTEDRPIYFSHPEIATDEPYRDLRFVVQSDLWD
ncbi:MAG TPA: hypothetical protein VLF60_04565 [Candidatus Saccharimonadales bacterium]|nr:hypothetical protein [Candidatus Saccharimonadales bacterium]